MLNFVRLIFIAAIDYENIFTTKISRFTVGHKLTLTTRLNNYEMSMCRLIAVLPVVSTTPAQPATTGELISCTLVIIISR